MSNFSTSQDLLNGALSRAGESNETASPSPLRARALEYLNQAYIDVLVGGTLFDLDFGKPWTWAREALPNTLTLKAKYDTGTITTTNGSNSATLSDPPAFSLVDRHIFFEGRRDPYLVTAHTGGDPTVTLNGDYAEASGAVSFRAHALIYDLGSDILRLVEPFRVYRNQRGADDEGKIFGLDIGTLRRNNPLKNLFEEIPTQFATVVENGAVHKVQFNRSVAEDIKIDYDFIKVPTALIDDPSSIPIIPLKHRVVLEVMTAANLLANEKADSRGSILFNIAKGKLKAMIKEDNRSKRSTSQRRGQIISRPEKIIERRLYTR